MSVIPTVLRDFTILDWVLLVMCCVWLFLAVAVTALVGIHWSTVVERWYKILLRSINYVRAKRRKRELDSSLARITLQASTAKTSGWRDAYLTKLSTFLRKIPGLKPARADSLADTWAVTLGYIVKETAKACNWEQKETLLKAVNNAVQSLPEP